MKPVYNKGLFSNSKLDTNLVSAISSQDQASLILPKKRTKVRNAEFRRYKEEDEDLADLLNVQNA